MPEGPDGTATPDTPTPDGTATSTATPAGNGTATGDGGGGGPWLDGLVDLPSVPTGWELLSGMIQGAVSDFAGGVDVLKERLISEAAPVLADGVDTFHGFMLTLPAPGQDCVCPETWAAPDNGLWVAALGVYTIVSAFALLLLWTGGLASVGAARRGQRRERGREFVIALALIMFGATVILPAWQHFWNVSSLAMAPSGSEFVTTPGNTAKLGLGVIIGAVLLSVKAVAVAVGLAFHIGFMFAAFAFFVFWPLGVVMWVSGVPAIQTLGVGIMSGYLALGPLQFLKAVILRMVFMMPLDFGSVDSIWTFIFITVGVLAAFVVIPWKGLHAVMPHAVFAAGGKLTGSGGGGSSDRLDRVKAELPSREQLREKMGEARGRAASRLGGGGSEVSNTQTRGSVRMPQQRLKDISATRRGNARDTSTRSELTPSSPRAKRRLERRPNGLKSGSVDAPYSGARSGSDD